MKLAILHSRLNPVLTEAVEHLRARRVTVDAIDVTEATTLDAIADVELGALRPSHDLVYLKTTVEPARTYAGALHAAGAITINAYPRVAELSNKLIATIALKKAGLPVPETWLARDGAQLVQLLEGGALVEKPCHGSRGVGVRVLRRMEDRVSSSLAAESLMLQRFHPSDDGCDHKLYVIGGRVFGVRRTWSVFPDWTAKARASESFVPDSSLESLALACGHALGLELYGLDVVISGGAPYVVDVNKCAGFIGVPGAAAILAAHLEGAVRAARGQA